MRGSLSFAILTFLEWSPFFSPPIILFIYFFKVTVSNLASYLSCVLQKVNPAVSFPYHRSKKINKITAGQSLEVLFSAFIRELVPTEDSAPLYKRKPPS